MARNLFLHLSALSNQEYDTYTDALRDILDVSDQSLSDDELECRKTDLAVVRAWLKGRLRDVGHDPIDQALGLLSPQLTTAKQISGGQILAILRLLMHVREGRPVSEGNVFIQASPSSPTSARFPSRLVSSASASEPTTASQSSAAPPLPPPKSIPSTPSRNPFSSRDPPQIDPLSDSPRRASLSDVVQAPPVPPASSKPRIDGMGVPSVPPGSTNPFLQRAKTHSGVYDANAAVSSSSSRIPPLPPRKPSHMSSGSTSFSVNRRPPLPTKPASLSSQPPPFLQQTLTGVSGSSSSTSTKQINGPAPPPANHHITPLMQHSLQASRAGASLQRAKEAAGRVRVLEVIRSSSDVSVPPASHYPHEPPMTYVPRVKSISRSPEKKGKRRPVPLPPRPSGSTATPDPNRPPSEASLARVASARLGPRARTLSPGPTTMADNASDTSSSEDVTGSGARSRSISEQMGFEPPPQHPARRPSVPSSASTPNRMPTHGLSSLNRHIRSPSYQSYHFHSPPAHSSGVPGFSNSVSYQESTPASTDVETAVDLSSPPTSPTDSPFSSPGGGLRSSRSQSMHASVSPTLAGRLSGSTSPQSTGAPSGASGPVPPPRRKRPESMQVPPRHFASDNPSDRIREKEEKEDPLSPFSNSFASSGSGGGGGLTSRLFDKEPNDTSKKEKDREAPFASLQRTFSALQARAQPSLARARYKAEANFNPRRGFVPPSSHTLAHSSHSGTESNARLVSNEDGYDFDDGGIDEGLGYIDLNDDTGEETVRGRERERARWRDIRVEWSERDNLKMPEGEGWRPL